MKKILNIVYALDSGGVETLLYNYYSRLDFSKIECDIIVLSKNHGMLEEKLKNIGCNIFHVTTYKKNLFKHINEIKHIIQKNKYDIIHTHLNFNSFFALYVAKKYGIKTRIAHAHGNSRKKGLLRKIINTIEQKSIKKNATHFFACSNDAGKFIFGKWWASNNKENRIIKNAISVEQFCFNTDYRFEIRKKYKIHNNKICLLHVGRFTPEKNHKFLIELFSKLNSDKYCLICVGEGLLMNDIKDSVKTLNLQNVYFSGKTDDVYKYYSAADIFLFPSYCEGLGIALVEAQVSGLKCISSKGVPLESSISDETVFLENNNTKEWLSEIENFKLNERKNKIKEAQKFGYDIDMEAKKINELLK